MSKKIKAVGEREAEDKVLRMCKRLGDEPCTITVFIKDKLAYNYFHEPEKEVRNGIK